MQWFNLLSNLLGSLRAVIFIFNFYLFFLFRFLITFLVFYFVFINQFICIILYESSILFIWHPIFTCNWYIYNIQIGNILIYFLIHSEAHSRGNFISILLHYVLLQVYMCSLLINNWRLVYFGCRLSWLQSCTWTFGTALSSVDEYWGVSRLSPIEHRLLLLILVILTWQMSVDGIVLRCVGGGVSAVVIHTWELMGWIWLWSDEILWLIYVFPKSIGIVIHSINILYYYNFQWIKIFINIELYW